MDKFIVYTSTGKNTRGICGERTCLIPCFGTMVMWQLDNIIAPLIKADFYTGAGKHIKDDNLQKNYRDNLKFFDGNVSDELLHDYFEHTAEERRRFNLEEYRDLKVKTGSDYFLSDIIHYREKIFKLLETEPKIYMKDLLFINKIQQSNNFYGINLAKVPSYGSMIKMPEGRYKPDMFVTSRDSAVLTEYNRKIAETIHRLYKNSPDKYRNMLGSPPEGATYYYVVKSIQE